MKNEKAPFWTTSKIFWALHIAAFLFFLFALFITIPLHVMASKSEAAA